MKNFYGLESFYEDNKDIMANALWSYMSEFKQVCNSDMPSRTMRRFIRETIVWSPKLAYFINCEKDITETMRDNTVDDFVDKFYDYAIKKFEKDSRGSVRD